MYRSEQKEEIIPLSQVSFYKAQKRIALRNCGVIDPENIDEYIAMDGYAALGKVLTEMTPDQVIVGSALNMPQAVRNLMEFCHISLEEAVRAATIAPASMMQISKQTGSISVGKQADFILCDKNLNIQQTICSGNIVYDEAEIHS